MFVLTFLGGPASVPPAERKHPGLLVESRGTRVLIDCGEGDVDTDCRDYGHVSSSESSVTKDRHGLIANGVSWPPEKEIAQTESVR